MRVFKRLAVAVVAVVVGLGAPASVSALTEEQLYFYSQNNILFYDPSAGGCNVAGGNNYNYVGDMVFSAAEMEAIAANQPFYEKAADMYGFPWQILAVLHRREHSLLRSNPSNGQGVYQLYSYTRKPGINELDPDKAFYPAGPVSDEDFQSQTNLAAKLVAESYGAGLDLNTDDGVKRMFFNYNGTAGAYKNQALRLGFTQEEANNGEGSPYVMNRFDERRDPTVEPTKSNNTWGQIKTDGGGMEYPANNEFGAFVMYVALGGSSLICNGGALVSGGFNNVEEADAAIVAYYREQAKIYRNYSEVTLDGATLKNLCAAGPLANCVAFTRWFIAKYTTAGDIRLGNGKDVVGQLAGKHGFSDVQSEPRAYAVFSRASGGGGYGHTGIVLGVDEANDKIIIGEAGCNAGIDWIGAHEEKLSVYRTSDYTYVYSDAILNGSIGG